MNQTAPTGCNSTFGCRTGGHPKPSLITWIRNGSDSNILNETNPRINIITDPEKGQSRLVIAGVTNTIMAFIFAPQKIVSGKTFQTRRSFLIQKVGADTLGLGPRLVTMLPRSTYYGWRNGAKFTKFIFIHIHGCYCYSRIYLFTFNN